MSASPAASPVAVLAVIGLGAVLGAWLRYVLAVWLNAQGWLPFGTLLANAMGGLLVGVTLGWSAAQPDLSPLIRLFLVTGFLGALTTFSTFSAEVVGLMMAEYWARAGLVVLLHLGTSLTLTWVGFALVRLLAGR